MINTALAALLLLPGQGLDPISGQHLAPLRDSVVLSLATDRAEYYRGEQIRFTLTIKNVSDQPVTGYFDLPLGHDSTILYYRYAAGVNQEVQYFSSLMGEGAVHELTLSPGKEMSERIDVALATVEPPTVLLNKVGRYEFQGVFYDVPEDSNGRLESNVVVVDVIDAPSSEAAAQVAWSPELAYLAQVKSGPRAFVPPARLTEATAFLDRYRNSRYAGPVKDGLLLWLQYRVGSRRATAEETALFEKLRRDTDTTPPSLHATASPASLWPPIHKLERIVVDIAVSDDQDPSPVVKLESVTCDDGCNVSEDVVGAEFGADDREFELRSERKGTSAAGRTYTITYSASDASGNKVLAVTTVAVPHDQGKR